MKFSLIAFYVEEDNACRTYNRISLIFFCHRFRMTLKHYRVDYCTGQTYLDRNKQKRLSNSRQIDGHFPL